MARPVRLELTTTYLEGKEDGARALYLQGYYSVFLRKSTPAARCTPCAKAMSWSKNGLKSRPEQPRRLDRFQRSVGQETSTRPTGRTPGSTGSEVKTATSLPPMRIS